MMRPIATSSEGGTPSPARQIASQSISGEVTARGQPSGRSHRIGYHPVDELPTKGPRIERRINLATRDGVCPPGGDHQCEITDNGSTGTD